MTRAVGEWDQVVVGAGSAGGVVASHLAFRTSQRVLLLEAGGDQPVPRDMKHPLRDASRLVLEGYNWDYQANLRTSSHLDDLVHAPSRLSSKPRSNAAGGQKSRALWSRFPYRLGKIVGGSSAVNGAVALRALPRDFSEWVKLGGPGWSWEHVLPFYKGLENDTDFSGDQHGDSGLIPISRPRPDQVHELDTAFLEQCIRSGVPELADLNGGLEFGVGPVPTNTVDGERMDVATTYLARARRCSNLDVRTGCHVTRVLFDGHRAVGVEMLHDDRLKSVRATNVVLSAGAIGTPPILIRSGVGDARLCSSLGVRPVVALSGVGENLVDHASVVIWALPKHGVCKPNITWRQVIARMTSGFDDDVDLQTGMLNSVGTATIPRFADRVDMPMVVGMSVMLLRPASRGRVFIRDTDPKTLPAIELALGSANEDIERLAGGIRKAWSILRSPDIANRLEHIQLWSDAMVQDDKVLRSGVRNIMNPGWHAAGSARMGPATDPMSVVDEDCRVHGVENLQVVDASVFPTIPSAPTNLTTIMLADKVCANAKE